jgi:hypothetical protein
MAHLLPSPPSRPSPHPPSARTRPLPLLMTSNLSNPRTPKSKPQRTTSETVLPSAQPSPAPAALVISAFLELPPPSARSSSSLRALRLQSLAEARLERPTSSTPPPLQPFPCSSRPARSLPSPLFPNSKKPLSLPEQLKSVTSTSPPSTIFPSPTTLLSRRQRNPSPMTRSPPCVPTQTSSPMSSLPRPSQRFKMRNVGDSRSG